jgi:hypothetical protein
MKSIFRAMPADKRPQWFSVVLSTVWILLSWRVHEYLVCLYYMAQGLSTGNHPVALPSEANFFVQFFGFQAPTTTIAFSALILGKDLFLERAKSGVWNIILAVICGVLLCWGWVFFKLILVNWGIVT